ncbi:hypothetical protein BKA69DRAFT_384241 [Paraphysoderma sedebokerense]|nr:hypothetical protein BKA69DRAFT_384241 [Paraphysoderma sedebokerense]
MMSLRRPTTTAPNVRSYRSLAVKIDECIFLTEKSRSCDSFCTIHATLPQTSVEAAFRTPVITNSNQPFFAENCTIRDEQYISNYSNVHLTVWKCEVPLDKPIGRLAIPRLLIEQGLTNHDTWYTMLPGERRELRDITGQVHLKIQYIPTRTDSGETLHNYSVTVVSALNLGKNYCGELPNPYVALHLLPDPQANSMQATPPQNGTENPAFNKTILMTLHQKETFNELHVSVWSAGDGVGEVDEFLGQVLIPVSGLFPGDMIENVYPLFAKPDTLCIHPSAHTKRMSGVFSRSRMSFSRSKDPQPKVLVKGLQSTLLHDSKPPTKKPHTFVEISNSACTTCAHCCNIIWPEQVYRQCRSCKVGVHSICEKWAIVNCKGCVTAKLKIKYEDLALLPLNSYKPFTKALKNHDYLLMSIVETEREEIATSFVRIYGHMSEVEEVIMGLLSREVNATTDVSTIFRANSMASKTLDVYMKHVGSSYLRFVLSDTIRHLVTKKLTCEVDPLKIEKGEDVKKNWKNLLECCETVTTAIFDAAATIPGTLRVIFSHLQKEVMRKFPKNETARYVTVASFIFLRFFVPAVLGPKLFGLWDEYMDSRAARTLTLIAKTLQNLANLVEFGQKEPFMNPMNTFLNSKFGQLKRYIDNISVVTGKKDTVTSLQRPVTEDEACAECARVVNYYQREIIDKLSAEKKVLKHFEELLSNVGSIQRQLRGEPAPESAAPVEEGPKRKSAIQFDEPSAPGSPKKSPSSDTSESLDNSRSKFKHALGYFGFTLPRKSFDDNAEKTDTLGVLDKSYSSVASSIDLDQRFSVNTLPHSDYAYDDPNMPPESRFGTRRITDNVYPASSTLPSLAKTDQGDSIDRNDTVGTSRSRKSSRPPIPNMALISKLEGLTITESHSSSNDNTAGALQPDQHNGNSDQAQSNIQPSTSTMPPPGVPQQSNIPKNQSQTNILSILQDAIGTVDSTIAEKNPGDIQIASSTSKCGKCNQSLSDQPYLQALDKYWHIACFTCEACSGALTAGFVAVEGKPYCKDDYLKKMGLACGQCGQSIDSEFIDIEGMKFHPHCKKCRHCSSSLSGKGFFIMDNEVYCDIHYDDIVNCSTCKQPIGDEVLIALKENKRFHPRCFNCDCGLNLATRPYHELKSKAYCTGCFNAVVAAKK